jgi:uncharacterized protein (DUF1778 family)
MAAKKDRGTATTSLSVQDPAVLETIRKAAALKGESLSKFILAAAGAEALRVLKGSCPGCGRSMKGAKAA